MNASMVDWDLAVSLGSRIAGDGPLVTAAEAEEAVGDAPSRRQPVHRPGP